MKEQKNKLRRETRKKLLAMNKEEYQNRSRIIQKRLFETDVWKNAETIGTTISIFPEVDTLGIIEKAWSEKKKVAVPKCFPEYKSMTFYQINQFNQLEKGYFDLYEPKPEKSTKIHKEEIPLLIVPGVVYSKKGYRIGFGGGYYDRFLKDYRGRTIALAFEPQITESIPVEPHDQKVEILITEKEVYRCNGS